MTKNCTITKQLAVKIDSPNYDRKFNLPTNTFCIPFASRTLTTEKQLFSENFLCCLLGLGIFPCCVIK